MSYYSVVVVEKLRKNEFHIQPLTSSTGDELFYRDMDKAMQHAKAQVEEKIPRDQQALLMDDNNMYVVENFKVIYGPNIVATYWHRSTPIQAMVLLHNIKFVE